MSEPALELQGLLRALIEQQTALLGAHAESMRLQRVLVEQLLGSVQPPAVARDATLAAAGSPQDVTERNDATVRTVEAVVLDALPAELPEHVGPAVVATTGEPQPVAEPVVVPTPGNPPSLLAVGGTPIRGQRYYQSAEPKPRQQVSPRSLDVLRRIQAVGEVAHLILTFGPHAGSTLGQAAQCDPDYMRRPGDNRATA